MEKKTKRISKIFVINYQFNKKQIKTSYLKVEDKNKRVCDKPWKNTLGLFREAIKKKGGYALCINK